MGFKGDRTDEEFEAALAAGLLWINRSTQWPRPREGVGGVWMVQPQRM